MNSQKGLSTLGMLLVLLIGGFALTCAFKIGPLYLDNYFVRAALKSLDGERIETMDSGSIRRSLDRYFMVNNVRDVSARGATVTRERDRVVVALDYERRVNLIGNLDVVVVFNNRFDSSSSQR